MSFLTSLSHRRGRFEYDRSISDALIDLTRLPVVLAHQLGEGCNVRFLLLRNRFTLDRIGPDHAAVERRGRPVPAVTVRACFFLEY